MPSLALSFSHPSPVYRAAPTSGTPSAGCSIRGLSGVSPGFAGSTKLEMEGVQFGHIATSEHSARFFARLHSAGGRARAPPSCRLLCLFLRETRRMSSPSAASSDVVTGITATEVRRRLPWRHHRRDDPCERRNSRTRRATASSRTPRGMAGPSRTRSSPASSSSWVSRSRSRPRHAWHAGRTAPVSSGMPCDGRC